MSGQSSVRVRRLHLLRLALFTLALAAAAQQRALQPSAPTEQTADSDARNDNVYLDGQGSGRGLVRKFTTNLLLDQKEIWKSPFQINHSSAKWWILAGLGAAALIAADHPVSRVLPFSGNSVHFGSAFSRAGQWYTVFPAAGVMFATGSVFHNETGVLGLETLAAADIVTNVVKVVARRERPGARDHGGHFEEGGSSFPSGHVTQAWALAAVVASEYGSHKWVPYASYGYASLIDVSRVLSQEHFTSDVFVGSAIGFFIGAMWSIPSGCIGNIRVPESRLCLCRLCCPRSRPWQRLSRSPGATNMPVSGGRSLTVWTLART